MLQRGGKVRSAHVEKVTARNLKPIVDEIPHDEVTVMTDTSTMLESVGKGRTHHQVNHSADEYVRYEDGLCITTNAVEGYFATLKRGVNRVYHHVGKERLHRYLTEFDFRYNARKVTDAERADMALSGAEGKRLMLRDSKERLAKGGEERPWNVSRSTAR